MTFLLFLTLLYFMPTIIGHKHRNVLSIFLVNFFLGWTVIGWIVAMIWACSADAPPQVLVIAGRSGSGCDALLLPLRNDECRGGALLRGVRQNGLSG